MTFEVIEHNWHVLEQRLKAVNTVDEVLKHHEDFLDTCLKECMLTNLQLLKILMKLLSTCTLFSKFTEDFSKTLSVKSTQGEASEGPLEKDLGAVLRRRTAKIKGASKQIKDQIVSDDHYGKTVATFDSSFRDQLRQLLDTLNQYALVEIDPHLSSLCTRLDFNAFYSRTSNSMGDSVRSSVASSLSLRPGTFNSSM
eukprot:CAMPEP_0184674634 /NCGR_PEP_ID=MMETSP0308-20130426/87345_1 /TAXON_ID=38269 /ORGANISM="Gloeochaete witrockiana, Strain SAG 46.84" /LENGTH=196 /DNA_ID=CAMNT_0027122257 /DNA_START=467 /DNA_END=1057 /DNA_ORIENTATION=+